MVLLHTLPQAVRSLCIKYKSFLLQVAASGEFTRLLPSPGVSCTSNSHFLGALSVTSDILTQLVVQQKGWENWDYLRTGRFLFITIFFMVGLV